MLWSRFKINNTYFPLPMYKVNGCLICELPADVMDGFHPGGGTIEGGFMIVEPVINWIILMKFRNEYKCVYLLILAGGKGGGKKFWCVTCCNGGTGPL